MMLPPLMNTLANSLLEKKLSLYIKTDPFWREQLRQLNGLHLYIELIDVGFKRVIQFGPQDVHLLAPYTEAEVKLITRCRYLNALHDAQATQTAIDEGHLQLEGKAEAVQKLQNLMQTHHPDWENLLAQILPDSLAYQVHSLCNIAQQKGKQAWQQFHSGG